VVKWSVPASADATDGEKEEETEWEAAKVRKVGEKGVTCFDVRYVFHGFVPLCKVYQAYFNSPDGRFLAFGSSDYTIGILDTNTLGVRILLCTSQYPKFTFFTAPTDNSKSARIPTNHTTFQPDL
jgi:prolactin regulatory element-binding protein